MSDDEQILDYYEPNSADEEAEREMELDEHWTPASFTTNEAASDTWRSQPPPKPKPPEAWAPAPQAIPGNNFTFERVRSRHCESDRMYTLEPDSEEGLYFLKWTRAALKAAHELSLTMHSTVTDITQSETLQVVSIEYCQLRVHEPKRSALPSPLNDPNYHPGKYTSYEHEHEKYCVNPSGMHYKVQKPQTWAHSFKLVVTNGEHAARLSCMKPPKDCANLERSKDVICIEYGACLSASFFLRGAVLHVPKRHIVEHLSNHQRWLNEDSTSEPTTDTSALEVLHELAGDEWRSANETLYVFRDGVWTQNVCSAFYELLMRHSDVLGSKYGGMVHHMNNVRRLATTKNRVDDKWSLGLDRLAPGLVPFSDGIYNVATRELREIERSDMLTKKFDFAAPMRGEDVTNERAQLESVLEDLFPDKQLKLEVLTRVAESLFNCTNIHKYFVQLWGRGNNGKTTLMRILQTAFPLWVQMPSVENLVARGVRNADAPQPWLIDVMGARILGFEEPPRGAKFDGSLLKLLRGNGVVTGRALYQGNVSYVPGFTIWLATNSPIEIDPTDEAVLSSIHSFAMPSCFVDDGATAPLGTTYVRKKIPNLEARFKLRAHKLALFAVLSEYYELYCCSGLPALDSRFSSSMRDIYREEHPRVHEVFERCVTEDKTSSVSAKRLFSVMQANGYEDTQKAFKLFLKNKYEKHKFVHVKLPNNIQTWNGLRVIEDGY